jgi:sulfide:quinone oxidoreductase
VLVVALGADLDREATPGLVEGGYEFYSPAGAARVREILPVFESGVGIHLLGGFFKCPLAPFETAFMLHDVLVRRNVRDAVNIYVVSPLPRPIPISDDTSNAILAMLAERGINHRPGSLVTRLDPAAKVAHFGTGANWPTTCSSAYRCTVPPL